MSISNTRIVGEARNSDALNGITCGMVSLGCSKNLVDSEVMLGLLASAGAVVTAEPSEAEVLIVNTCGFVDSAKEESIDNIFDLSRYKENGSCRVLIVAGCLSQRYGDELADQLPEVDAVIGTGQVPQIVEIVERCLDGGKITDVEERSFLYDYSLPRLISTGCASAYVKIAEGCDNRCSYCAIPSIRGRFRSRRIDSIVEEVKGLVAMGTKEIILIAQDTTRYGEDIYGRPQLSELLRRLDGIDGLIWIRVLYMYPDRIDDELLGIFAESGKICKYIDMPLQHADPGVLRAMNRKGSPEDILDMAMRFRNAVPGVVLRTTFIVGFPGETDAAFESLLGVIKKAEFDRAGIFKYSREEGTPAGEMPDQISQSVKRRRYNEAMSIQRRISYGCNKRRVGTEADVLIESQQPGIPGMFVGRSPFEAPDVDGIIKVTSCRENGDGLRIGSMARVRITKAEAYDLYGTAVE